MTGKASYAAPGGGPMTNYAVVPDGLTAYGVEAISASRFLSMRGFPKADAAGAWIAEQKAEDARAPTRQWSFCAQSLGLFKPPLDASSLDGPPPEARHTA